MSVRFVLLCEDEQIACFIRRFLRQRNVRRNEIRERIAPPGSGSGEQWVRRHYPTELTAVRAVDGLALLVGTDADVHTATERMATLDRACRDASVPVRTRDERVAMIIPRRTIETWFAYLRGENVDETTSYPRYRHEADCRNDVRQLAAMCRDNALRAPWPPSLDLACLEYRRIS